MPYEYGGPFNDEALEAASVRALALHQAAPTDPLEEQIEKAVHEHVCSCAVEIEDGVEGGRSGLHEALVKEVRNRLTPHLEPHERDVPERDQVDLAPEDSFPASDPPSWISRRPGG